MQAMGTLLHFSSTNPKCQLLDSGLFSPSAINSVLLNAVVSLQLILRLVLPRGVQTKTLPSCLSQPDAVFLDYLQKQELLVALHQQLVKRYFSHSNAAVELYS